MSYKDLKSKELQRIEAMIKGFLFAERDRLNTLGKKDQWHFDCTSGYYGEAFGILHALEILGYGYLGSVNVNASGNLRHWFGILCDQVLEEEKQESMTAIELMRKYFALAKE